jgi:hypothetical protein
MKIKLKLRERDKIKRNSKQKRKNKGKSKKNQLKINSTLMLSTFIKNPQLKLNTKSNPNRKSKIRSKVIETTLMNSLSWMMMP